MTQFPRDLLRIEIARAPDCPIPAAYFLSVNIPLIWVIAPIAALLSRRDPVVGLAF